jgi:cytochrome c oxidase subunit 2
MMKKFPRILTAMPVVAAMWLAAPAAHAAWTLNMTPGISEMSREIYSLHMLMFWWCVGIAIVVFGFMIYSMVHFRKSKGAVADQNFLHSNRIEIIWTLVPVLILISMAVPAARVLVQTEDPVSTDLTIRVTGYQWKWAYEYADTGVTILSTLARDSNRARQLGSGVDPFSVPNYLLEVDHPLVVPAGVKVRVLISANDVIHSWWVPALAIKKDAIPGFINEAWFDIDADKTGTYRGQCAELCGRDHGFMPIVLEVKSKQDFDRWLKDQEAALKLPAASPAANPAPAPAPASAPTASSLPAAQPSAG